MGERRERRERRGGERTGGRVEEVMGQGRTDGGGLEGEVWGTGGGGVEEEQRR